MPPGSQIGVLPLQGFLRLLLASASRGMRVGTTAARSTPPASLSARLLESVPSSRPLARSSKNCSPTAHPSPSGCYSSIKRTVLLHPGKRKGLPARGVAPPLPMPGSFGASALLLASSPDELAKNHSFGGYS